jgi:hypothetical protein
MPNAADYLSGVGFDFHAATATKALLTAPKLVVDVLEFDRNRGWETS